MTLEGTESNLVDYYTAIYAEVQEIRSSNLSHQVAVARVGGVALNYYEIVDSSKQHDDLVDLTNDAVDLYGLMDQIESQSGAALEEDITVRESLTPSDNARWFFGALIIAAHAIKRPIVGVFNDRSVTVAPGDTRNDTLDRYRAPRTKIEAT